MGKTFVYIKRSLKFLVALVVLYAAAMWIMSGMGLTLLTPREMAMNLLMSRRGIILTAAVLIWAAVYPKVGFVVRQVEADIDEDRERIANAFIRSGYVQTRDENGILTFRAANPFRRLRLLFEDEIRVSRQGRTVVLEGIRRSVAEVEMRLKTYMQNAKRNED
ncbi:MAG: hypothetical protein J1E04_04090 [Alistipes sp.]|nr:hypothetical protein [Alistipes sp.]